MASNIIVNEGKAEEVEKGKLRRLTVRNFRCIGPEGVEVELDDIVVLVGPNNSGKSSILRAYEIAMKEGSKEGHLKIDDFPNSEVTPDKLPEIQLITEIIAGEPSKQWIGNIDGSAWKEHEGGPKYVRERWVWSGTGAGKRSGWNVDIGAWDDKKPWGFAAVANARRPVVHPVLAFDAPETQAKQIHQLLKGALINTAKEITNENGENLYNKLITDLGEFQSIAVEKAQSEFSNLEAKLNEIVSTIFEDHVIQYVQSSHASDASLTLFPDDGKLTMGHLNGHRTALEFQGSGARRTMLWATLRYLSEMKQDQTRANILLIDEPELCLHPNAIREACRVLYDLASKGDWQVMITTHSPVFIDLSRNNTSIVRVGRETSGAIRGTTLYRPESVALSADDRTNLKLLNIYDPYVAEFFFGGKIVVVEGDTEYSAFKMVMDNNAGFDNVHIIRARGKAPIASVAKILNQFGSKYSILHDSDTPRTVRKNRKTGAIEEIANPAWGSNMTILNAVQDAISGKTVRLVASLGNFEAAFFDTQLTSEKPYSAIKGLREDHKKLEVVTCLLNALIDHDAPLPSGCIEWSNFDGLHEAYHSHNMSAKFNNECAETKPPSGSSLILDLLE